MYGRGRVVTRIEAAISAITAVRHADTGPRKAAASTTTMNVAETAVRPTERHHRVARDERRDPEHDAQSVVRARGQSPPVARPRSPRQRARRPTGPWVHRACGDCLAQPWQQNLAPNPAHGRLRSSVGKRDTNSSGNANFSPPVDAVRRRTDGSSVELLCGAVFPNSRPNPCTTFRSHSPVISCNFMLSGLTPQR